MKAFNVSRASSLVANLDNSSVYFGGVTQDIQQQILERLEMVKKILPIRYFGVSLSTKRLIIMQC